MSVFMSLVLNPATLQYLWCICISRILNSGPPKHADIPARGYPFLAITVSAIKSVTVK